MESFMKVAAQGEIKIYRLADDAEIKGAPLPVETEAHHIIGHSETGHHHVIDRHAADVTVMERPPEGMRILQLLVKEPTSLKHMRSNDTHAPINLDPGKYEVRIGREYDPLAKLARQVAD